MQSSTNRPPRAKAKWSRPILVALIAVSALSFLAPHRPNKKRLLAELTECLREERFERLYEEGDDSLPLNVSKEKFVRRMKAAAAKLKAVDAGLNFKPEESLEYLLRVDERESYMITAVKTLEGNGKSVFVFIYWTAGGEFSDIRVSPRDGTPDEFNVYGVSYASRSVGGRVIED